MTSERELERRTLRLGTQALYRDGRYYDQLYHRRSADVRFYVEMARAHASRSRAVLELGAGSGRVTAALAKAGFSVVGVDSMAPMLKSARARIAKLPLKLQGQVELRRADLRNLRLSRRFSLVVAPFNVFQHLYTRRDVERALAACRRHLTPRGRLIFDVMLPDLRALCQSPARALKGRPVFHPADGRRYDYYEASHYSVADQIRTINMLLQTPGRPEIRHAIPLAHRQFFPAELEALLHYNGFALERLYGDFARGPLLADSESQVVVARPRSGRQGPGR